VRRRDEKDHLSQEREANTASETRDRARQALIQAHLAPLTGINLVAQSFAHRNSALFSFICASIELFP
jgi:hypothetical protein